MFHVNRWRKLASCSLIYVAFARKPSHLYSCASSSTTVQHMTSNNVRLICYNRCCDVHFRDAIIIVAVGQRGAVCLAALVIMPMWQIACSRANTKTGKQDLSDYRTVVTWRWRENIEGRHALHKWRTSLFDSCSLKTSRKSSYSSSYAVETRVLRHLNLSSISPEACPLVQWGSCRFFVARKIKSVSLIILPLYESVSNLILQLLACAYRFSL